jgi:membrane protease YdiL (CAAX protease family)
MKTETPSPPGFWTTVWLLLAATRKRSAGRRKRQQDLLRERSKGRGIDWGPLGFALAALMMLFLNGAAAFVVRAAVVSGQRVEAERQGKIVVSHRFLEAASEFWAQGSGDPAGEHDRSVPHGANRRPQPNYASEGRRIAENNGGTPAALENKLRDAVRAHGTEDLIAEDDATPGLSTLARTGTLPAMLGSMVLIWWAAMLVFQGEGLELDLQRRRHPMWEWLFSHPVPPGAVFFAEMLSPIAANPIYWGGPIFVGILYGLVYEPEFGLLAAILIGIPVTIAAACLGKAFEVGVVLRFSSRSRGAMLGLMSWMGYTSMMLFFVGLFVLPKIIAALWKFLDLFTVLPWPWLRLFLGGQSDGSFSFLAGMIACWTFSAITIAGAVWFSVWGAQQGLSGNLSRADSRPSRPATAGTRFSKDPLYRKEFLWFIRDRSAIVQTILIPLTVASYQLFNLRGLLSHAQGAWNYLCGAAILFGTYFLWILGPRSLSSEGTALWIALTWPRGLESLLKAKAWLWSLISSGLVLMVLCYAAYVFPASIWKIALVGIGWFFFARSMAEKTVTLVTVPSSSGETQKIPWGRRWAAQLGMLTFSIGILTQQWQLAVVGIVYSFVTAAAMWENFRARLPYLYDPWSETMPPPPTLMHAMIAISILVEGGAVFTAILLAFAGRENLAVAQAIGYAFCAVAVSIGVASFLSGRDVSLRDVWTWPAAAAVRGKWDSWFRKGWLRGDGTLKGLVLVGLPAGAIAGFFLGLFAKGYVAVLEHFPATAEIIHKSQEQMARVPNLRVSYIVMAVGFAPFAEEYLFRGLLFRALDREWGGWRAVVGSAAFFAVYHPPLAWLPVALLGAANALIFKKTGQLAPAVILHMVYNAVVLMVTW